MFERFGRFGRFRCNLHAWRWGSSGMQLIMERSPNTASQGVCGTFNYWQISDLDRIPPVSMPINTFTIEPTHRGILICRSIGYHRATAATRGTSSTRCRRGRRSASTRTCGRCMRVVRRCTGIGRGPAAECGLSRPITIQRPDLRCVQGTEGPSSNVTPSRTPRARGGRPQE